MFSLIQLQADTLAAVASSVVIEKIAPNTEISVLEFILKGGFFLIPISILLFYTLYLIFERIFYIKKVAKIDQHLISDIRNNLNNGNIDITIELQL